MKCKCPLPKCRFKSLGIGKPKTQVQKPKSNLGHPPRFYTSDKIITVISSHRFSCQQIAKIQPGPPALDFGPKNDGAGTKLAESLGIPVEGSNDYSSHIQSVDDLRDNFSSFTVQTNPEDAQKAIQEIKQFNAQNHDYKTFSTNCTTVCRDVANKVLKLNSSAVQPSTLWTNVFSMPMVFRKVNYLIFGCQPLPNPVRITAGLDSGSTHLISPTYYYILKKLA
jgi:hypothetical protein